ncbi:MAG: T9SS type A sorting domain-containing protein [Candidatus Zhuqueibacterota bacterium]
MNALQKNLIRTLFLIVVGLMMNSRSLSQTVTLAWSPSANPEIASYGIYRSIHSDTNFVLIATINHPDTIYLDDAVLFGNAYFYAATSIDNSGNESGFSNVIDTLMHNTSPVELSRFTCQVFESNVLLTWTTTTEQNNFGFEIQRSHENTSNFEKIGFVHGNGTTNEPRDYQYSDENLDAGTYFYRLKQIDFNGDFALSNVNEVSVNVPNKFYLGQNYPNPFNAGTSISYSIPEAGQVQLVIYNMNGERVLNAVNKLQEAGSHSFHWNGLSETGDGLASGVYYYKIKINEHASLKKMTLVK